MRLLLDTHVLLWWLADDPSLAREAEGAIANPASVVFVSSAGTLPRHHDDPFDRMLVAQALAEGLTIVTRDPRLSPYGVSTLSA